MPVSERINIIIYSDPSLDAEPHPEELPPHRIRRSCEQVFGLPRCEGAAGMGPERCTCDTLSPDQLDQCLIDAWLAHFDRGGDMCSDCAFRKGSPEQDRLDEVTENDTPFRCHHGMPVDARGGFPMRDAYCPPLVRNGRNIEAEDYPVCAGWLRARAALAKRAVDERDERKLSDG